MRSPKRSKAVTNTLQTAAKTLHSNQCCASDAELLVSECVQRTPAPSELLRFMYLNQRLKLIWQLAQLLHLFQRTALQTVFLTAVNPQTQLESLS